MGNADWVYEYVVSFSPKATCRLEEIAKQHTVRIEPNGTLSLTGHGYPGDENVRIIVGEFADATKPVEYDYSFWCHELSQDEDDQQFVGIMSVCDFIEAEELPHMGD